MQSASALTERDPMALGPYLLLGRVADGGMGVVYLGRHDGRADSLVAVKTLKPQTPADSLFRTRLRHEIQAARTLSELGAVEASVARLVDADDAADRPWLAWEYIPGPSLQTRAGAAPLTPDEVDVVARELAAAIAELHDVGYAHCDVKPANVVLGPDGLRLVDLGLVHDVREPALAVAMGSPGWSPPEQSAPDRDGRAMDVHGWGMCVAFAASGVNPFGADRSSGDPDRMRTEAPRLAGLDEGLRPLVAEALAADPLRRPTMADIVRRLRAMETPTIRTTAVMTSAGTTTVAPTQTQSLAAPTMIETASTAEAPAATPGVRWRAALPAAAAAIVALLLASWWVSRPVATSEPGTSIAPQTSSSASPSPARPSPTATAAPVVAKTAPSPAAARPQQAKAKPAPHGKGKGKHRG